MVKKKYLKFLSLLLVLSLIINFPTLSYAKLKVKLNKNAVTLTIGSTVDLKVKNTTKSVKWSSSNKNIASVNSYGEVTGKRAGSARITAKVGKKKLYCTVTVPNQNLSDKSIFIQVGEKQSLSLYGIASSDTVFWGSDYESIATVSQSGEITAKSIGTTTVYAVINSGIGKTYSCEVVVYGKNSSGDIITETPKPTVTPTAAPTATPKPSYIPVTKVTLAQKSMWLYAGNTSRLTADVLPADATNKKLRWNSTDASIASVGNDGTVKALKAGTTAVYVTTVDGEFMAICTVTVTGSITPSASPNVVPVNKVSLSRKEIQLNEGESQTLHATISPNNATNKTVTWSSGNEAVAKVDSNGRVSTVSAGSTMVFVTTVDGEYVAVCKVKVVAKNSSTASPTPAPTASATPTPTASPNPSQTPTAIPNVNQSPDPSTTPLSLNRTTLEIPVGQEFQFIVTGITTSTVVWSSSDVNIANITQDGKISAKKVGNTTITASVGGESLKCEVTIIEEVEAELKLNYNKTIVISCKNSNVATYINIPDGVVKIGIDAFKGMKNLRSVNIPSSVREIEDSAFMDCDKIYKITMLNGVKNIGDGAFSGCSNLEEIILPDSVTLIGHDVYYDQAYIGAFSRCSNLKKIVLPNNVTKLGPNMFKGCNNLESVTIPESVTSIGSYAFSECTSLQEIKIPSGVKTIAFGLFHGCTSLQEIILPNNMTYIGGDAFSGCNSLKRIKIPNGVKTIYNRVFAGCSNLKEVIISDGITRISDEMFSECINLEKITIPSSVESIERRAFYGCESLKEVTILNSDINIGNECFLRCYNLSTIYGVIGSKAESWAKENDISFVEYS